MIIFLWTERNLKGGGAKQTFDEQGRASVVLH